MASIARLQLWPLRACWVVLALLAVASASGALADRSTAVAAVLTVLGWLAWGAGLVAMLVPRSLALTAARLAVPTGALAASAAAVGGTAGQGLVAATLLVALLTVAVLLAPWTTDAFVDGSSYGPERRIPLRTPVAIAALAVVTWAVVVAGAVAGPLLLAAHQALAGIPALVVGWAVAVLGARSLHQLSRRWLVLVPTGMVLHDPLTMPEPQLFLRQTMASLGPAVVDDPADEGWSIEDLTAGASGLVVELALDEPVELLVLEGRRGTTLREVDAVRFTPSRPAELFAEGRARRLPVS
ncbi:MAG: hypothetical protein U0P45_00120 [Acidimicrobiales bacterium]